jgi:hypothetical protein
VYEFVEEPMYRVMNVTATILVVVASLLLFSGRAYAHERRTVGPYQLVVGWLNEPAYVGLMNSLDLRVTDTRTTQPVAGLEKSLTADAAAGGVAPFPLAISARFGTAGAYNGWIMPTAIGGYTFHIKGKIDTLDVDEKFTSGPNTFGDIEDTQAVQYPAKVPVADALGKKLDAIASTADQTRLIALAALVLGLVAVGAAALAGRRRA